MKSLLDPTFRYVPSGSTDVAATFQRIRREQAEAKKKSDQIAQEQQQKVEPLKPRLKARSL